jgi:hypothetical protein
MQLVRRPREAPFLYYRDESLELKQIHKGHSALNTRHSAKGNVFGISTKIPAEAEQRSAPIPQQTKLVIADCR